MRDECQLAVDVSALGLAKGTKVEAFAPAVPRWQTGMKGGFAVGASGLVGPVGVPAWGGRLVLIGDADALAKLPAALRRVEADRDVEGVRK